MFSKVFDEVRDLSGDISIPDLEKTLSDDAEVAGTQNVLRANSPTLLFCYRYRTVRLSWLAPPTAHLVLLVALPRTVAYGNPRSRVPM